MTQTVTPTAPADGQDTRTPWDTFISAKTADAFCRAWLALLCQQIAQVRAAAVLVEDADSQSFVPIAVWPQASPELGRLSSVVEACLRKNQPVVQPAASGKSTELAYPVMAGMRVASLVVLDLGGGDAQAALRQIHWSSAWLSNLLSSRDLELATQTAERTASVLDCTAIALRHDRLQQALFELTNALALRFQCAKVAIGLASHGHVRLTALSAAAHFDKNTPLAKAYAAAMEEAFDVGQPVQSTSNADPALPLHARLLAQSGAGSVLSCPLIQGATTVGLLTLEKSGPEGFDDNERAWLDAFAAVVAPIIEQRRAAERSSVRRLAAEGRALLTRLFGPRHLIWKTGASLLLLLVTVLSLVQVEYRVSAKTVIEGEVQRVAAAPFAGFIAASHVRAGDTVRKGQPLATLDDRELRIEQARWASERDQYAQKLREAIATHNLTDVQVVDAQLRQAEAQLALVSDKIAHAQVTAPYDGIVVTGDLSQQIGAPVELGKELFTVAPLQSYRVILQVDEREIRQVRAGQHGRLVIIGIAGEPLPLTVSKVTPVATTQDGKNFFRVEARLAQAPVRLRPGMEGIGKIDTGRRQLWWILTHPLTDWLALMTWKWLP